MASIQSLGVGSGLLTSELVEQIIEAERKPVELRLDSEQAITEARISAFGEIKSSLSGFDSALQALSLPSAFEANKVTSSDESLVTATTSSAADEGSYILEVGQLARNHSLASGAYDSIDAVVGSGVLTFQFGTTTFDGDGNYESFDLNTGAQTKAITIDAQNGTLSGIRDAVNDADFGVQASLIDDGSGYRLVFTSTESGAENSMEITATGSAGIEALNYNLASETAAPEERLTQTIAAQDAQLTVNGLAISRSSNSVSGVIEGTTLNLKGETSGPVTVGVSRDPAAITEKIQKFVDAYNQVRTLFDSLTEFDPDAGANGEGSLLTGDGTLRTMTSGIDRMLRSVVAGLDGEVRSLTEIGVNTNQHNNYQLVFDSDIFEEKFASDPEAIQGLFATAGNTSDSQIEYASSSTNTQAGTYDVEVSRLATVGTYAGLSVDALGTGPIVIDENNDEFTIRVNGSSAVVSLTQDSYASAGELAEQMQVQINSAGDFADSGRSVSVSYDSDQKQFVFNSNSYGSESSVSFTAIDDDMANTLGLVLESQGAYRGNQLASLSTPGGLSSENFDAAVVLDADTSFTVSVNGTSSALLTVPGDDVTPASYNSPDELVAAIQAQIDADPAINVQAGYAYDADTQFGRLTFSSADSSDVITLANVSANAASTLGLFAGNGSASHSTAGLDVAGTINGVEATGNGQYLRGASGNVPARPGFYLNTAHGDLTASTGADSFQVSVDGVSSGDISLGVIGDASPAVVAAGMQSAINNSPAMLAAGVSVTVEYDPVTGGFGIISQSTGPGSSVRVTDLQGDAGAILGFAIGTGVKGETGTAASGSPDPSSGLRLRVRGGETGDRGSVTFIRGLADQLGTLMESYIGSEGLLTNKSAALNEKLEKIDEERTALDLRIERSEERLRASFLANDMIIANLNSTADFLSAQLRMLENLASPAQSEDN